MKNKITATFVQIRFQDSGKDQAPDYYVYEFTNIIDANGTRHNDKWIKETKLLKAVPFKKGDKYEITLSNENYSFNSIKMPFPVEVTWHNGRVYMRGRNSIIKEDKNKRRKSINIHK